MGNVAKSDGNVGELENTTEVNLISPIGRFVTGYPYYLTVPRRKIT